jgi:hypothetical protein
MAEQPEDFPGAHGQIEVVHGRALAKNLDYALEFDHGWSGASIAWLTSRMAPVAAA